MPCGQAAMQKSTRTSTLPQGPCTHTARHSGRSVSPWDTTDVRMAKPIRREWANREMTKLEWRA